MILPHRPLLLLAAAWLVLGVAAAVDPGLLLAWQVTGVLALVLAATDAFLARGRRGQVRVERLLPRTLAVGKDLHVHLRFHPAPGARVGISGWAMDRHPDRFRARGLPLAFRVEPGRWMQTEYTLAVTERGQFRFQGIDLRLVSPLGLWLVQERLPLEDTVRVYPDFAKVVQYTLLATDNRLSQMGILRRRRRGEGLEFHQLRDYRKEDPLRNIDWKASARARHLVAREYQDERDQQIVFLLDCSQRMAARDGDLSHFDHSLNALLLLAWVALRQGDAVGLCTFAHDAPRFLPPKKSVSVVTGLLNGVYDLQPSNRSPDYLAAAEGLTRRLKKRALIVLATNLRDEDDSTLLPAVRHLAKRHTITVASLKEPVLEALIRGPVRDFDRALTRAAALEYAEGRRKQAALLRHAGVQLLDVGPAQLPVALINHYWARKRAGAL